MTTTPSDGSDGAEILSLRRGISRTRLQAIRIKPQNSWRHASGIIYIGVRGLDADDPFNCYVVASSDTVHSTSRTLYLAEALSIQSTQGKYRLVLRTVDKESCAFDLIKD